ncbi:hypothetical protein SDRG_11740 [Saprolegnia diclina VS20]|uniref:Uncharacterized protein n=1 Tax=Saprolegnia diclina (strain VS20) TaxID=1156394 RepID=T0RL71_SAPDV|nr:hypothetical protein SDRG_11740 [Saprolegnia diclina VS20]EQC30687.1 hypothetical protein SDRG_11740 [Saprolegnia diclina VS20]|eukprot:XP_008616013.1 hypothetical protein SDRG_11740 [Saprolegnia diclina VS20]
MARTKATLKLEKRGRKSTRKPARKPARARSSGPQLDTSEVPGDLALAIAEWRASQLRSVELIDLSSTPDDEIFDDERDTDVVLVYAPPIVPVTRLFLC